MNTITVDRKKPVPLYWQIKQVIEGEILNGGYKAGEVVATEDNLIERFGVSRIVAIKTLDILEEEGYVRRKRGKGTVLVSSTRKNDGNIGFLFMQTEGHLYSDFSNRIVNSLSSQGFHLMLHDYKTEKFEKNLSSMLSFNPSFFIVCGRSSFPFHLIENLSDEKIIFVIDYERQEKLPASYVLQDRTAGTKLQIDHALECGYKNIIQYVHKITRQSIVLNEIVSFSGKLLTEKNFSGKHRIFEYSSSEEEKNVAEIRDALIQTGKNTCILCMQDSHAVLAYKAAHSLGWNVPQDIGVIGYYNTPWTKAFNPALTSVCIKESVIADTVVDIIVKNTNIDTRIKPVLIKRQSTRLKNA